MPDSQKPDRRLQSAESPKQQAAASRDTSRPADSVPVVTGQFTSLPATFGRYEVERLLGRGAMGAVYLARDTQLGRLVALKIPKVGASGSKRLLQRLQTEAKAAARLDHPCLCQVYDAGEINGQCFIAMQYIEGETLKAQLEAKSKSVAEAVSLIVQLAKGLSEAHAIEIIHRDLKPENIIVNRRGIPVVMDFGLAKFSTISSNAKATQAGTILGSPAYMSPEQASGSVQEIDQRSDLYALGVILFEMLTGELPFSGSAMQILGQKSLLDPPSPLTLKPNLSPPVAAICHKMIAKYRADRYPDLKEVIDELQKMDAIGTVPLPAPLPEQSAAFPDFSALVKNDELNASSANSKKGRAAKGSSKSPAATATLSQRLSAWWNERPPAIKWTALGGAAFVFLCGVIIITITNGEGPPTRIVVPDSSTVTITQGEVDEKASLESQATDSRIAKSGWQGWPADSPPPAIAPFDASQAAAHQAAWAKYLGVPVEHTNTIGMKFVLIPPGEFTMGSSAAEIEASREGIRPDDTAWLELLKAAGPEHKVILTQPIYLGVTEVTQSEYQKVMGQNPSIFASTGARKAAIAGMETTTHPVEMVSWDDAAEFCAKLSQQEQLQPFYSRTGETITQLDGTGYRLPTEAEWEFACHAGTVTKSWIGDQKEDLVQAAWIDSNSGWRTHAVGELKANPFGLSDILGNLCEWVQDGWDATYYAGFREKVAINPVNPFSASVMRTARGGGWNGVASICRSACRNASYGGAGDCAGFRVSLTVDAVKTKSAAKKAEPATIGWQGWPADAPPPAIAPFDAAQANAHQNAWAKYLKAPVEYKNSIGMKFMLIPPGEFLMGSTAGEIEVSLKDVGEDNYWHENYWKDCIRSESPQHKVILTQPIYLGINEVTQAEYETVMKTNPSHFAPMGKGKEAVAGIETANLPVDQLSWNDAAEYCTKLSQQENVKPFYSRSGATITPLEGTGYRLPTEAEWEFGCRAGTATKYWVGDKVDNDARACWFKGISSARPHAVGELKTNPFGLADVHGNVWEWVQDALETNLYDQFQEKPAINPNSRLQPGYARVIRGGSWHGPASFCRSSFRTTFGQPYGSLNIGFRVALSIDAVRPQMKSGSQAVLLK